MLTLAFFKNSGHAYFYEKICFFFVVPDRPNQRTLFELDVYSYGQFSDNLLSKIVVKSKKTANISKNCNYNPYNVYKVCS